MKSNTLSFTTGELNVATGTKKDPKLSISRTQVGHPAYNEINWPTATTTTVYFYPRHFKVDNQTGSDVEFVILTNDNEEAVYDDDPANYPGWIKLSDLTEYEFERMAKINKIVFRAVSGGTATSALRIDFWGFFQL